MWSVEVKTCMNQCMLMIYDSVYLYTTCWHTHLPAPTASASVFSSLALSSCRSALKRSPCRCKQRRKRSPRRPLLPPTPTLQCARCKAVAYCSKGVGGSSVDTVQYGMHDSVAGSRVNKARLVRLHALLHATCMDWRGCLFLPFLRGYSYSLMTWRMGNITL